MMENGQVGKGLGVKRKRYRLVCDSEEALEKFESLFPHVAVWHKDRVFAKKTTARASVFGNRGRNSFLSKPWEERMLTLMEEVKKRPEAYLFMRPVDEAKDGAVGYYTIIKEPMDFGRIIEKLKQKEYANAEETRIDVNLIFYNCKVFNEESTYVAKVGVKLQNFILPKINKLIASLPELSAPSVPPAPSTDIQSPLAS